MEAQGTWHLTGYGGGAGEAGGKNDLEASILDDLEEEDGPRDSTARS